MSPEIKVSPVTKVYQALLTKMDQNFVRRSENSEQFDEEVMVLEFEADTLSSCSEIEWEKLASRALIQVVNPKAISNYSLASLEVNKALSVTGDGSETDVLFLTFEK